MGRNGRTGLRAAAGVANLIARPAIRQIVLGANFRVLENGSRAAAPGKIRR
jgi:hypothetical protein